MTAPKFAGADWVARQGKTLSPFGVRVADILGQVYRGIYHMTDEVLKTDWSNTRLVVVGLGIHVEMATYDYNELTQLVFLCHAERIRLAIRGHGMSRLQLQFSPRTADGSFMARHPNLQEAVKDFFETYPEYAVKPAFHPIVIEDGVMRRVRTES